MRSRGPFLRARKGELLRASDNGFGQLAAQVVGQ